MQVQLSDEQEDMLGQSSKEIVSCAAQVLGWRLALASCCSCCGARMRARPRHLGQLAGGAREAALEEKLLARLDSREWESE